MRFSKNQNLPKKIFTHEFTIIVLMAACGIATKPIIGPLAKMIAAPFFLPGGVVAGAFSMLWPMLALLVVQRFGTALLVGLLEGMMVLITGFYGSHGLLSLLIYVTPCVFIDGLYIFTKDARYQIIRFLPTALGNVAGVFLVGFFIMHLPVISLFIGLMPAFVFGGVGGWFAEQLYQVIKRIRSTALN